MADPVPLRSASRRSISVVDRVLGDLDDIIAGIAEAMRREIPEYGALDEAVMRVEVLPVTRRVVESFFAAVRAGTTVPPRELRALGESGRARLRLGVPLDAVLHAYRIAGRLTWDAILTHLEPGDELLLGDLAARWIDFMDNASSAVAKNYLAESHTMLRALDARRRELVEALLSADGPAEVAAVSLRFSTVLAAAYVPVLVSGGGAAARIDALLAAGPEGTLGGHRGENVLLLVPDRVEDVSRLQAAAGDVLLAWGRPAGPGSALLSEVTHVEELVAAARSDGRATGAFGPEELLVEQLLLGNTRVALALRERVVDVLLARDPSGAVVSTLRRYLATGSIPETARLEVVHPNTVTYRLGRVRDLTGLDPRIPAEATLLVLGLGLPT
ncbi:MAG: hypothetical protein QOK42_406 [Frankiaceae bacterium]|nr:hypothetical protein [Frankiaceae bacterium]MDX6275391.1 hypothetical protein [Frankiales bacterium]